MKLKITIVPTIIASTELRFKALRFVNQSHFAISYTLFVINSFLNLTKIKIILNLLVININKKSLNDCYHI